MLVSVNYHLKNPESLFQEGLKTLQLMISHICRFFSNVLTRRDIFPPSAVCLIPNIQRHSGLIPTAEINDGSVLKLSREFKRTTVTGRLPCFH